MRHPPLNPSATPQILYHSYITGDGGTFNWAVRAGACRGGEGRAGMACLPMPICLIQEIGVRVANCGRSLWF